MRETAAIASDVFCRLGDMGGQNETARYAAVAGNGFARWLLPVGRPEVASVLAGWSPYRLRSRAAWSAIRAASKVGRLTSVPGTSELEVECPRASAWATLGWDGLGAPVPVIYVGTPGLRRKAVVHLVEQGTGTCKSVVKVPLTDEAKTAVLREADVLEALNAENFEQAPRLLRTDRSMGIATQTYIKERSGARELGSEIWRLLRSLTLPGETTSLSAYAKEWAQSLNEGAYDSGATPVIEELECDDAPLQACWQHGDFAPWNIRRQHDGRCALIDWEDARRDALPLQDAFHFLHMQDFLFGAKPRLHARDICPDARGMGVSPEQCCKLEAAYLVEALVTSVRDENLKRRRFVLATLAQWQRQAT